VSARIATVKKILLIVAGLVLVAVGASFVYATYINKADAPLSQSDVDQRLDATTTTGTGTTGSTTGPTAGSTTGSTTAPTAGNGVDGAWKIGSGSEVGYRVKETINGFATEANGRSTGVTGSLTIVGTSANAADFTVDMTTFSSDQSRRDSQFNNRIMQVAQFPTATFRLTDPIDFGAIPAAGQKVTVKAVGDLTLHGVTRPVAFSLDATFKNGKIGILGRIPILFADYGITNPSFATISTEDNGQLEFVLILTR
jgi:polyisoprenoid-binding protein YceI